MSNITKPLIKSQIIPGIKLIEKKPSKHTTKRRIIEICQEHTMYSSLQKKNYTYYTCQTVEDQYYPAANSTDRQPLILDGLVGSLDLSKLKREYKIYNPWVLTIAELADRARDMAGANYIDPKRYLSTPKALAVMEKEWDLTLAQKDIFVGAYNDQLNNIEQP